MAAFRELITTELGGAGQVKALGRSACLSNLLGRSQVAWRYHDDILAIRTLLEDSELPVSSPLHKIPHHLENRLTRMPELARRLKTRSCPGVPRGDQAKARVSYESGCCVAANPP